MFFGINTWSGQSNELELLSTPAKNLLTYQRKVLVLHVTKYSVVGHDFVYMTYESC